MFDINSGELIIIALVALMVFGPQRLPELLRKAGDFIKEMRAMGAELQRGLERDLKELKEPVQALKDDLTKPVQELKDDLTKPLEELKDDVTKPLQEITESAAEATSEIDEAAKGLAWTGPVPEGGPGPVDALADLERIEAGEDLLEAEE